MSDTSSFWVGPPEAPETYRLIKLLSSGGEGQVWAGEVPLSEGGRRRVAVKISAAPDGPEELAAWESYGHMLRSLSHPGIVRVSEVFLGPRYHRLGDTLLAEAMTDHSYVVMDLIEGVTLAEWLAEHPEATASTRMRMLGMVAAALDTMHSGQHTGVALAHGDVKPSNIIIREDGAAILVDLGMARLVDGTGRAGVSRPYAAPELSLPGAASTVEADRYAFVASLAHALTGQVPALGPGGQVDPDGVAAQLAAAPTTAQRHALNQRILEALAAEPAARPAPLASWLPSLSATLSQLTTPNASTSTNPLPAASPTAPTVVLPPAGPAAQAAPAAPATAGASAARRRGPLIALAAVVLVALLGGGAWALSSLGASTPKAAAVGDSANNEPTDSPTTPADQATDTTTESSTDTASSDPFAGVATDTPTDQATDTPTDQATDTPTDQVSDSPAVTGSPYATGPFLLADPSNDGVLVQPTDGNSEQMGQVQGNDTLAVNGKSFDTGVYTYDVCCNNDVYTSRVGMNLERSYRLVTGRIGVLDSSQSGLAAHVQVLADGKVIFDRDLTLGQSYDVKFNVTGVLRLDFIVKGELHYVHVGWGDPAAQ